MIADRYRLEQMLGRGGMGSVYRAVDMQLDRAVAVKVVRADLLGDEAARLRFRHEAQILARIQHPSIVAIFDCGTFPDGGGYLVMELVQGEDLRRVLLREGRLEAESAASILASVCAGLDAAHREGVLHGDLKPENILLPDGGAPAKILDFGTANAMAASSDSATIPAQQSTPRAGEGLMIVGTPAYMAPEQLRGAAPEPRTDVFSLGVIAYEMLSGELPFGRGPLAEVVLAQARGVPTLRVAAVPPAVERAVRSALESDIDRRPPSPLAFAHLLSAGIGM